MTAAPARTDPDTAVLTAVERRVLWLATAIVHHANRVRPNPSGLKVVSDSVPTAEHPNLQLAVDAFLGAEGRSSELHGVVSEQAGYMGLTFAHLVAPNRVGFSGDTAPTAGPVQYRSVALGSGETLSCVDLGLYLVRRIVEQQNGWVSLRPRAGGGTVAEVRLPRG